MGMLQCTVCPGFCQFGHVRETEGQVKFTISAVLPLLIGNTGKNFRVVRIKVIVEKREREISSLLPISKNIFV